MVGTGFAFIFSNEIATSELALLSRERLVRVRVRVSTSLGTVLVAVVRTWIQLWLPGTVKYHIITVDVGTIDITLSPMVNLDAVRATTFCFI